MGRVDSAVRVCLRKYGEEKSTDERQYGCVRVSTDWRQYGCVCVSTDERQYGGFCWSAVESNISATQSQQLESK